MLWTPALSRFNFTVDNYGTNPGATPGTSVVPGASNAEGTFTECISDAAVTQALDALFVRVSDGATSTAAKPHLLDIGIDPAGGTSYSPIISNVVCGASASSGGTAGNSPSFLFPIRIPAGSAIAARVQGSNATAGTVRISMKGYGKAARPDAMPVGAYSETIGTITGSSGVTFTPGNAADGTWVSLGTTTKPMWWWQLAYQVNNGTITAERAYVQIAHGDSTNKHIIMTLVHTGGTGETCGTLVNPNINPYEAYCPLPAGTEIWIRGRCENAPDTGYSGVAIGIGG